MLIVMDKNATSNQIDAVTAAIGILQTDYAQTGEGGNENIILCEGRGRTFVHDSRDTLDLSAIPHVRHEGDRPYFFILQ